MNYIILDLEWNQASDRSKVVQSPVMLRGEIIQIGAVKTDERFDLIDTLKINVSPKYYKKMNRHVEKITGITNAQLAKGEKFPEAFARFKEWCGDDFRFITWGFDDVSMLSDNMAVHGFDPSWGSDYINLQLIYKNQIDNERTQWALSDAVERLQIPMDAQAHDAMNDAWFTYQVCRRLDMQKGLAEYSCMAAGIRIALRRDVIKNLRDYRGVLSDERVRDIPCPSCGAVLDSAEWLSFGGGRKSTISECEQHGKFLVKLSCKKMSESVWTATRTIYRADDKALESYQKKLQKQHEAIARRKSERKSHDNNGNV
ncbi:MAG: exonuclease domain-containing protein [Oscillospiraceae bacterium]|nr:exonuclease domain-containing protein [Oscillospiraceae bacterium]